MKPTFIELTHSDDRILINLDNIVKISPRKEGTLITFNFSKGELPYSTTVTETYEVIKKLIESQK
jgi:transposase